MFVENLFSIKGKTALVTGGSRGIGEMIASGFCANGAKVYITARSKDTVLETAKIISNKYDSECIGIKSDISSEYTFPPDCGSSGCAVFNNLETGTYNFSATDGTNNWTGAITVSEGCLKRELD